LLDVPVEGTARRRVRPLNVSIQFLYYLCIFAANMSLRLQAPLLQGSG
jgi:hypothetical protein